jgi:cytochrome c-type biogenesis protein CcmE
MPGLRLVLAATMLSPFAAAAAQQRAAPAWQVDWGDQYCSLIRLPDRETPFIVGARVVPGTVTKETASQTLSFHITDGTVNYPVVFKGLPPDTFTDSVEVVVEGRLQRDGVIHATNVLAKCGSRYEAVPKA